MSKKFSNCLAQSESQKSGIICFQFRVNEKQTTQSPEEHSVQTSCTVTSTEKAKFYNYRNASSFLSVQSFEDSPFSFGDFVVLRGLRVDVLPLLTSIVTKYLESAWKI